MRKDVKIGLVLSLVAVVLAGWYFIGNGKDKTVPMNDKVASAEGKTPAPADAKPAPHRDTDRTRRPAVSSGNRPPVRNRPTTPAVSDRSPASDRIGATTLPPRTDRPESPILLSDVVAGDGAKPTTPAGPPVESEPSDSIGADKAVGGSVTPDVTPAKAETPEPPAAPPAINGPKPTGPDTRGPLPLVGRTPRPAAGEQPGKVRTHRIGKGDTLAILAELFYGKQEYAEYLIRVNPGLDPRRLVVGQEIVVPEVPGDLSAANLAAKPQPAATDKPAAAPAPGGRTYTVKSGDSFWRIADRELGDGNRWREVYELNKDQVSTPDRLKVGQVIQLPQK
ncbi:MAG: LysM peptidoglycan-binding domain-containing protein [Phycisphaerae bacterium]|nr:LysM peptidoglycan-binding domain-containing protein [Phycisphaerae bacterium]